MAKGWAVRCRWFAHVPPLFAPIPMPLICRSSLTALTAAASCLLSGTLAAQASIPAKQTLLPAGWNAKTAADKVLARLVNVIAPHVKGAHDAEFVIANGKAYVVTEANDERPGEAADWPFVYVTLSVVDLTTMEVKKHIDFARGGQIYENQTLPPGACFVPRILKLSDQTLRCYFASEEPKKRQSMTWFIDFDLATETFGKTLGKAKLKTQAGVFDMEPQHFHRDAAAVGFKRPPADAGLYIFDSFKHVDGELYVALNNFLGAQNGLAKVNANRDTFEILGHYNEPAELRLTESAVNRLPDGTWMAICRQEGGSRNYIFTTSPDGRSWSTGKTADFVPNGTNSKPTFDKFKGVYYLGWQEATQINGVNRSVFNVDVSADGREWQRKYRFESEKSFQYPAFHEAEGLIYVSVTQGDTDASRKERIMFGVLE